MPASRAARLGALRPGGLIALLLVTVEPSRSAMLDVPSVFPTIQSAINAAADGDVVVLAPGTYNESPTLSGKAITLASRFHTTGDRSYIEQTVLSGGGRTYVVRVLPSPEPPTLVGLTLRNADDGILGTGRFLLLDCRVTATGDGIDFESGSGGLVRGCVFDHNSDDGIDIDNVVSVVILDNLIQLNGDDGIEMRLHPYVGDPLAVVIRGNTIARNGEDGIQLIGYESLTSRIIRIENNLILDNAMAGLGMMCCENTVENYQGSNIRERVGVYNNTFAGNDHGLTGGDSLLVLNNLFLGTTNVALKRVDAGSIAAHNLFFGNGTDHVESNVDLATTRFEDPQVGPYYDLSGTSPAIDAGAATFSVGGRVVWRKYPGDYTGPAPDLGAIEYSAVLSIGVGPAVGGVELLPPAPNPVRGPVALRVHLPAAGKARLEVVDVAGRRVRLLVDGLVDAGRHDFAWDGRDASGAPAPAGIYFARFETAQGSRTRALVKLE